MSKIYSVATSALADLLNDGMLIASGGFGMRSVPERLRDAVQATGVKNLTFASNNAGIDNEGIGKLLRSLQVRKMIASYVGENKESERQYLSGKLDVSSARRARWPSGCAPGVRASPAFTPKPALAPKLPKARK